MPEEDNVAKIQVDSDWKAEAQAEKERLAEKEKEMESAREDQKGQAGMPEASFRTLVGTLASQAIMGLGAMNDPKTGRVMIDLEGAQFSIDLLSVLDEKTKGNLEKEEGEELTQVLQELRARFVQISQLVAQQAATQGVPSIPTPVPTSGTPEAPSGPSIIQP